MQLILCLFFSILANNLYAQNTELLFYRPFAETTAHPSPKIANTLHGECIKQSEVIRREDAIQCKAEGKIYDPCFIKAFTDKKEALCPQSPWSEKSTIIQFAEQYPQATEILDMSKTYPWALELKDGIRCQAFLTQNSFDNLPVRYFCNDQSTLLGHLQRCSASWKILQHKDSSQLDTVEITKAWF
ncbi:Uncharacterised protein (plasmid) [Legionella adelaidensis]|uniref:Uncharacterized protein n=1 Tax=Legionella adelaidensis TaxID=45056 RepID=A0A0W0R3N5_9GAMM|nr:hypothetical protein [Legionella adelaidensis]KTC65680.1 hypothetical protein Lade_0338 [Legionella adelaidensis]VEH85124.1 Uncharacterised protein [Legionella adelaidensis]